MTDARFLNENLNETARQEFFATGNTYVQRLIDSLAELYPDFTPSQAVDFGCGTGRILMPLARACEQAIGVDISPAMLAESARNTGDAQISNVQFCATDEFLQSSRPYNLVHSSLVFQHIRPHRGYALLEQLLTRLQPGGVAVLQFCTQTGESRLRRTANKLKNTLPGAARFAAYLRGRAHLPAPMEMHAYDKEALAKYFQRCDMMIDHTRDFEESGIVISTLFGRKKEPTHGESIADH